MLFARSYSDEKIIELILKSGKSESQAIQFLLDSNRGKIKALILKMGGSDHDAESILIEGVTSLIFNIRKEKFKGDSTIATYLYSICRRVWQKSVQKEQRYTDLDSNQNSSADEASPFNAYSDSQLKEDVNFLLEKLGVACKTVLSMWAGHFSMTEIALELNYKNAQIAMNKKNKCMKKLKEITLSNAGYSEQLKNYLY